jgi:hypothetical protein
VTPVQPPTAPALSGSLAPPAAGPESGDCALPSETSAPSDSATPSDSDSADAACTDDCVNALPTTGEAADAGANAPLDQPAATAKSGSLASTGLSSATRWALPGAALCLLLGAGLLALTIRRQRAQI